MKKLVLLNFLVTIVLCALAQSPIQNKVGGICFRTDDHQGATKWRDWNALFNKYDLKFSLAINASRLYTDTAAVNALKEIAASGHELMDHTPDHHMGYFTVRTKSDTLAYFGNTAVDHFNGTKVCLKIDAPNTTSFIGEGTVNLIGNKLISNNNGEFHGINGNPYFPLVYLPSTNQYAVYTAVSNKNSNDPDTLTLQTYWQEPWKNDTLYSIAYHKISTSDVVTNSASNLLLAQRSKQLFAEFGLPAPKTWIQPGGSFALLNKQEVKLFSEQVGYTAGAVNIVSAQKCYNEVDSIGDKRYGMQGPDFYEETNTYQGLINIFADRSARHFQSFGLSHMYNVTGGWAAFLNRVESVLIWSVQNNIPLRTYNQWASIIYDSTSNPMANVLPLLNKDKNGNSLPDGFTIATNFLSNDGVIESNYSSFGSASNNSTLASINNLGGLEKGLNEINIYTKGQVGDSIKMVITFPEISVPTQSLLFGAGTSAYEKQTKYLNIPENISRINVSFVVIKRTNPGMVRMSFMEMKKYFESTPEDTSSIDTTSQIDIPFEGDSSTFNKKGGVCFRVDDYQNPTYWRALNQTFNAHQKKFTLGINASRIVGDTAATNALREIAAAGHELADHTPDHSLAFFNVSTFADTLALIGHPGITKFIGRKVCLKIDSVLPTNYANEGLVNIAGNQLISQNNGEFTNLSSPVFYSNIYLPFNQGVYTYSNLKNKNANDPDTITLGGYYGETVNLGNLNNIAYKRITQYDIKPNAAGINLLIERSISLFEILGLPKPKTLLIPSNYNALLNRAELKFFAAPYGYIAGDVYVDVAYKCFNEIDENNDKAFAMHGLDFKEENNTAKSITGIIADNSAKHHSSFGMSMLSNMTGGFTGYLARIDTLLTWCNENEIPVFTYKEWAQALYSHTPNPFVNVFPNLQTDLNSNNQPDGYTSISASYDINDGVPLSNNKSFSRTNSGVMASVQNLGGLEKGNCTFNISTKGNLGDSVRINYSFPELGNINTDIKVPANTSDWNLNTISITIPNNVSRMTFTFYTVKQSNGGTVKISGMQLLPNQSNKNSIISGIQSKEEKSEPNPTFPDLNTSLVFPNPFQEYLQILVNNPDEINPIEIRDMLGKKVDCSVEKLSNNEFYLFTENITSGLYVISIQNASGKTIFKKIRKE